MSKPQSTTGRVFIDYTPAELHENNTWEIVYYVKNPFTGDLQRKRNRVKPMTNKTERRKLAKRMILNINKRLEEGWNPLLENQGTKEFTKLSEAIRIFIKRTKREYDDGNFRYDTYKTYRSQCNVLSNYLEEVIDNVDFLCFKFNQEFIGNYLDYIRYDKNLSARTRDNYLGFLGTLSAFLLEKKYIAVNPTEHFSKINRKEKNRILIDKSLRIKIFEFWKTRNHNYLTLCMIGYYCLIRRTELTKIQVGDVSIANATIWIGAQNSKSRTGKHVTIPNTLLTQLSQHIKMAHETDYLFSANTFMPGTKRLHPDGVTKAWKKMRRILNLPENVKWYSLKDSGITDLLAAGVPLIAVRNQARHENSQQTDKYTPRKILKANQNIKEAKL